MNLIQNRENTNVVDILRIIPVDEFPQSRKFYVSLDVLNVTASKKDGGNGFALLYFLIN